MMSARSAKPLAKRARVEVAVLEDSVTEGDDILAVAKDCPVTVHPEDFEHLKELGSVWAKHPDFRLLPMPAAAYTALGIKAPGTASLADAAQACFSKPSTEMYTGMEVRDLRETCKATDFPAFYTGPAHPHMQPEGGARVIVHESKDPADAADEGMAAGGAGAGAGAGARAARNPYEMAE